MDVSAIALDTTHEINCQTLYTFNQVSPRTRPSWISSEPTANNVLQLTGNAAVGLASINLSIRA
jgi:hypothetical protein